MKSNLQKWRALNMFLLIFHRFIYCMHHTRHDEGGFCYKLIFFVCFFGVGLPAPAAPTSEQRCTAAITGASGEFAQCRLKAEGQFATSGDPLRRDNDLAKCAVSFETSLTKAQQNYGLDCLATEPKSAFEDHIVVSTNCVTAAAKGSTFAACGTGGGAFCGDGAASGTEACDLTDLRGSTCQSLGLGGGILACTNSCAYDTSACAPCNGLIYLIDDASRLLSFDPRKIGTVQDPFTIVGTLSCPASATPVSGYTGPVVPYAIAVDRTGKARVLYTSGEFFDVNVADASCTATTFQPNQGNQWSLFDPAYSTDTASGTAETLFVGGGSPEGFPGGFLGLVHPATLTIQTIGPLPIVGDSQTLLTGNSNAELFGLFPSSSTASIQKIDKTSGSGVGVPLAIPGGLGSTPVAWAFAHWGGKFYLFVTNDSGSGPSTRVARIDRGTANYEVVLLNVPYVIVAAGVATCAPLTSP